MQIAMGDSLVSVKAAIGTDIKTMEAFVKQERAVRNLFLIRDNKGLEHRDKAIIAVWSYSY